MIERSWKSNRSKGSYMATHSSTLFCPRGLLQFRRKRCDLKQLERSSEKAKHGQSAAEPCRLPLSLVPLLLLSTRLKLSAALRKSPQSWWRSLFLDDNYTSDRTEILEASLKHVHGHVKTNSVRIFHKISSIGSVLFEIYRFSMVFSP